MSEIITSSKRYLSRKEASEHLETLGLPMAVRTLAKLAVLGGGPSFVKFGRSVRYPREALETWLADRISPLRRTTNDTVGPPSK